MQSYDSIAIGLILEIAAIYLDGNIIGLVWQNIVSLLVKMQLNNIK